MNARPCKWECEKQITRETQVLGFIDPEELADWEYELYESVMGQYKRNGKLSEKQITVLEGMIK